MHVDRARRQWPSPPAVAAAQAVDVGDHHRLAALRCRGDLGRLAHLALAVAVDLGHRDLREVVFSKEREQVVGEVVAVVVGRVRLDLELLGGVPVGRELVEGGVDLHRRRWVGPRRPPGPEVDVAQRYRQFALGHLHRPAVLGAAEFDHVALAVGAEPQGEAPPAPAGLNDLSARPRCHQVSLGTDIGSSMQVRRVHRAGARRPGSGDRAMWLLLRRGRGQDRYRGPARRRRRATVAQGLSLPRTRRSSAPEAVRSARRRRATRLCRLGQRQRRRLAGPLEVRRDPGTRESQARSRPGAEPYGAKLAGVLVHPPAGLAVQARDLGGVDERLGTASRIALTASAALSPSTSSSPNAGTSPRSGYRPRAQRRGTTREPPNQMLPGRPRRRAP